MGSGQNFLTQVGSAIFGLGLENFPLNIPNFFQLGQKKSHQFGSKSTGVKAGTASFFAAVQK